VTAMENIALWHERDISHSSTERIILPDASEIVFYMLKRMQGLIEGLNVYPKNMLANMAKTQNAIFSGSILLALIDKGFDRQKAYALSQEAAFCANQKNISMQEACLLNPEIKNVLSDKEIAACCDIKTQLKNVDFIFNKALKKKRR
jgi:adenylosuccinate lyase